MKTINDHIHVNGGEENPLEPKKKWYALIILLVVVAALLASYDLFFNPHSFLNSLFRVDMQKRNIELRVQTSAAVATGDAKKCTSIRDATYKNICLDNIYFNLANTTQDPSYCLHITNTAVPIEACLRGVVNAKSVAEENSAVCDEANNVTVSKECRDSYYIRLAIAKKNIKICLEANTKVAIADCQSYYQTVTTID